jgi:hypothetical protein
MDTVEDTPQKLPATVLDEVVVPSRASLSPYTVRVTVSGDMADHVVSRSPTARTGKSGKRRFSEATPMFHAMDFEGSPK